MGQVVQIAGALLIVGAYLAYTQGRLRLDSVQFLGMNMVGALVLTVIAYIDSLYGFLILEGVWTWVSARGFRRALKARQTAKQATKKDRTKTAAARSRGRKRPDHLRRVD